MFVTYRSFILLLPLASSALANNYFYGITASGSEGGKNSYTCRTQDDWNAIAKDTRDQGFHSFRMYTFDCNALEMASSAAASQGVKLLAGIYVDGTMAQRSAKVDQDTQSFINAVRKYGEGRYAGLTVGNEMNDSPQNIIAKVNDVRTRLRSSGVNTAVSTVHTWVAVRDSPVLCSGDFVGANAHVFFDGQRTSNQAGDFMFSTVVPSLKRSCPGKPIMITESGWPSRGNNNNAAVASVNDERTALSSLNCAAKRDPSIQIYAFEHDDQLWKSNDNERSFGIVGKIGLNNDILNAC
ncbi:glycoside hydrolase superfamily [Crepidotus variabilis]|uniref:glucan endo-1,3-beta-D-glucosidase n=1 Tax=Crepidotus variabilis TaxID=179855 RepID=A0A9P6ENY9_9AGAR|nr:glycoside hydrolase superfamily [Crepidotus variabilis]